MGDQQQQDVQRQIFNRSHPAMRGVIAPEGRVNNVQDPVQQIFYAKITLRPILGRKESAPFIQYSNSNHHPSQVQSTFRPRPTANLHLQALSLNNGIINGFYSQFYLYQLYKKKYIYILIRKKGIHFIVKKSPNFKEHFVISFKNLGYIYI